MHTGDQGKASEQYKAAGGTFEVLDHSGDRPPDAIRT